MSQEPLAPGGPKKPRRDSILKARQTEEVIITKNDRRVSFHNVKVVQYYDKDIKNCPELLHNGTPVKEKINDTLGSDGVFTPGRTTISENSNHSSKNNTIDMFGEGAKKPMPIVPNEEHARFEVRETPPGSLEITNFNSVDMTVFSESNELTPTKTENTTVAQAPSSLEYTDYETIDMSISNESTKMDDTLQMFSKSGVQTTDSDSTISETMQMFANVSAMNNTSKVYNSRELNKTADMFANVGTNLHSSPAVDETIDMFNYDPTVRAAGNMDPDNTMELFKSPLRQSKSKRTSLSTTLNMFDTPEKQATPLHRRISMSNTMAMFESPARNQTQQNRSPREADNTVLHFEESQTKDTILETEEMDITDNKHEISGKRSSSVLPTTKSAETVIVSSDKTGDYSVLAERIRGASPPHMSILHNETVLLTDRSVIPECSTKINQGSFIMEDTMDLSRPHRTLSKTLDALMSETKHLSMRRPSVLEENRGMCLDIDFSDMVEYVEPRLHEKTAVLERGDDMSKMISMDISQMSVNNTSVRTNNVSYSNHSSRSRRRSSLSNTIRDLIQQSPVPAVDLSISADLSFNNHSNLFDDMLTRITYLENGSECSETLRHKMLHQFVTDSRALRERKIKELEDLSTNLEEEAPEKAKAIKTLNSRKLGAVDRDLMLAARYLAEKGFLERRVTVAKEYGRPTKEMLSDMAANTSECEIKADMCDQVDILKNDVTRLNEHWKIVTDNDIGAMKTAFSRHNELIKALEKEEEENMQLQIQSLMKEKAFIEMKYREHEEIGRILENAKKEKECNKQILLERLRNGAYETQTENTTSSTFTDNNDYNDYNDDQEDFSTMEM